MAQGEVTLQLSRDEALVLFEWVSRFNKTRAPALEDQAEERVLWDLESRLESVLAEPFRKDYAEALASARDQVRDSSEQGPGIYSEVMSPLAKTIYALLRPRVPSGKPQLSYTDLVAQLPAPYNKLEPDSDVLSAALGELVTACRAKGLPAIAAMVVRHREGIPGPGYYKVAHPNEAGDPPKAMTAWAQELDRVKQTTYPNSL